MEKFTGFWETDLSNDLLIGAVPISTWLYGGPEYCRRVFHLAETSRNFPHFKMGSKLHIRKSVMLASMWAQEERHWPERQKGLVQLHLELSRLHSSLRDEHARQRSEPTTPERTKASLDATMRSIERLARIERDQNND